MSIGDTRFPVEKADFHVEIYHRGERPGDTSLHNRTLDGHGPMYDTGERLNGRTVILCPNTLCNWSAFFTRIVSTTVAERHLYLTRRNNSLAAFIRNHMAEVQAGKIVRERALGVTVHERDEHDRNQKDLEGLRGRDMAEAWGAKFAGTAAGSLHLRVVGKPQPKAETAPAAPKPEKRESPVTAICEVCGKGFKGAFGKTNVARHMAKEHVTVEVGA